VAVVLIGCVFVGAALEDVVYGDYHIPYLEMPKDDEGFIQSFTVDDVSAHVASPCSVDYPCSVAGGALATIF
jgi:hypothetical protein